MKKIIFVIILSFLSFSQSFAITQGRLLNFSFATYAINNYQLNWAQQMYWAIPTADSLRVAMTASIAAMNIPYILSGATPTTITTYSFEDNEVTESNFLSSSAANYNFVYYFGHGNVNRITMWTSNTFIYNNHAGIGVRNTYWAWLSSCLVFRNDYSNQDPWFDGIFKGTHSILGESSLGFGNYYVAQAAVNFALRWIYNGDKIWDAYYNSILVYMHQQGGYDIEPKIVYRYGYINGNFFEPWEEKFKQAYKGPIFHNNDYTGIGSRWITLGNPLYEMP